MEELNIQPLVAVYHRKLASTSLRFKRYLYEKIHWDTRMIGIKGERGVGKTTLILQHIKETFKNPDEALYISMDHLWFTTHSLIDLVDYLYARGVVHLYIDEIHRCRNWSQCLKNLYDNYPDLNIVYTGSSLLEIDNSRADLSRRQTLYSLHGLSFREYLAFEKILNYDAVSVDSLLSNHVAIALDITQQVAVLKYFQKYLQTGYYPFYKEAGPDYFMRLQEIQTLIMDSDLAACENISYETTQKMKKLMMIIADNLPFMTNVSQLCQALSCTRDSCLKMFYTLDRAKSLRLLTTELKNYRRLVSPNKAFLGNPNLIYALATHPEIGTVRETFFAAQLDVVSTLQCPAKGDFLVDGRYLFEVGGAKKTFSQIKDIENSFLAIDDVETGYGNRIPLWLFGFLY